MTQRIEQLRSLTSALLNSNRPAHYLRPEVVEMSALLANSQTDGLAIHQDILEGGTQTPVGLALSSAMAAMCTDDFVRTIAFIRGTHAAIGDVRKRFPDRPARILYVGCGPYATIAVPLMTAFSPSEATFTLLDVHSESIASAKSILDTLCLSESVMTFVTMDAGSYQICPDNPPDVILMEIMQASLESEPQVDISRRLLQQAPNATLIPEEISVDLILVDPSKEFDLDNSARNQGDMQRDRISVGQVFVLNKESIYSWKNTLTCHLPGASVRIPDSINHRYQPMLFTNIRVYQDQALKDYDSGLTCPRILPAEEAVKGGDTIHFHYELGAHPGLRVQVRA